MYFIAIYIFQYKLNLLFDLLNAYKEVLNHFVCYTRCKTIFILCQNLIWIMSMGVVCIIFPSTLSSIVNAIEDELH